MSRWKLTAAVLGFLAVVVMPVGVAWAIWCRLPVPKDVSVFAPAFSDVVGPLFAALAFAGLLYTALMQREELSLQREELRENRAELKRTADAQTALVEAAKLSGRLTAMTTLMGFYQSRSSDLYGSGIATEARRKVPEIARKIESLLAEVEDEQTPEG